MINRHVWQRQDFAEAMSNAAKSYSSPKLMRLENEKLHFNGFWRNGDKQNVCIWLNRASWHDAKTGEGGGCKEFVKTAFNMDLPEFMSVSGLLHN